MFLTSAPDGSKWSASRSDRFTRDGRVPIIHWIGGWVEPRGDLDKTMRIKKSLPWKKRVRVHTASGILTRDSSMSSNPAVAHLCSPIVQGSLVIVSTIIFFWRTCSSSVSCSSRHQPDSVYIHITKHTMFH